MSAISGYSSLGGMQSYMGAAKQKPSKEEMEAKKKEAYESADVNGDGKLDAAELETLLSKAPKGSSVDTEEAFTSFDTDEDGYVSETELDSGMQSMRAQMEANMNKARFAKEEGANGGMGKAPSLAELFLKADSSGDDSIDATEFSEFLAKGPQADSVDAKEAFSSYDTNADGALSEDEFEVGMEELRASMTPPPPPPPPSSSESSSEESSDDTANSILTALDADGDGKIDTEELSSGLNSSQIQKMISAYIEQLAASYSSNTYSTLSSLSA